MTIDEFRESLDQPSPPAAIVPALQVMWYEAKGNWDQAHRVAQGEEDRRGAWVHAYLHRVEGDQTNAAYWYHRAGRPVAEVPLDEEWRTIVLSLLAL